jgi:hypothetical protein
MAKSHLERTLSELKMHDFLCQKVEHFNMHGGVRQDLFGCFDILAAHPRYGIVGVQVCGDDWSSHVKKLTGERREAMILWLASGGRALLVGWRQLKDIWTPRIKEFTLSEDYPEITGEVMFKLRSPLSTGAESTWLSPDKK